jgi:hypothetical protein
MGPTPVAMIGLLLILASGLGRHADGADSSLHAAVRQPTVGLGAAQADPEVVTFKLGFNLHIANRSTRPVGLPLGLPGSTEYVRVTIVGIDSQGSDAAWAHLLQATFIDNGALSYQPCTLLRPGSEGNVRDVRTGFLLLKKQLVGLGKEQTIRLRLMVTCRQPGGRIAAQEVTSDAFRVRLTGLRGAD